VDLTDLLFALAIFSASWYSITPIDVVLKPLFGIITKYSVHLVKDSGYYIINYSQI